MSHRGDAVQNPSGRIVEDEEEEDRPVSIASLRSRFESLAASNNQAGPAPGLKSASRSNGLKVNKEENGNPPSRSDAPRPSLNGKVAASSISTPASQPTIISTPASPTMSSSSPPSGIPSLGPPSPSVPSQSPPTREPDSLTLSAKPARRAGPAKPPKPASMSRPPSPSPSGVQEDQAGKQEEETSTVSSVKSLRERFGGPSAEAGPSRTLAKSPSLGQRTKSPGPVALDRQGSEPRFIPSREGDLTPQVLPTTELASSPGTLDSDPMSLAPSSTSTEPVPRAKSPIPPSFSRSSKPAPKRPDPRSSPSGSTTGGPVLAESENPRPLGPVSPPVLPTRRPTLPALDPSTGPPVVPGNRPLPASSETVARKDNISDLGPGPPKLPQRSRAATVTRSDDTFTLPPRLPARQGTLSTTEGPSSRPIAQSASLPVSPQRPRHSTFPPNDDSPLPPPPTRNAVTTSSPARRDTVSMNEKKEQPGDVSSEDEEEEEPAPLSGLTASAKRALEDYPDATMANRRPPSFSPEIRMIQPHHIYAFAVFGRHVVTAAHHVRVYDTQLSEKPTFVVDLKDTGLDFRIKEPRVTAMGFRPGSHPDDEGRWLWCGTKDGHLWELDIMTGQVTDTRPSVHGAAVVNIFRYKRHVLTLDENGKLLVYDVPVSEEHDTNIPPTLSRTLRVTDRFTFAEMIRGQLWTATAPTSRSTTTAASKGATVRVYDPCAPGGMPPAKTVLMSEWSGAVTSAALLPLHPEKTYLGHEGGYVSIWSSDELSCLQVLKISPSDITALAGVGEKLWAGGRKGQVHVFDVSKKPWHTTNTWPTRSDHSVHMLQVDPWAIEQTGRCAVWSITRDSISAWDGLLAVDWIDRQMNARQAEYSTYREVKTLVCSWNIDSAKPTDLAGSEDNATFLEQLLDSVDQPDIIVFGFQEVIPLMDKKLTAKTLLFGGKNKEAGQTADKVTSAYRHWLEKLSSAVRVATPADCQYVKIHSESLVGLFTCVFVKADQRDTLRDIDITVVKRGLGNIYGNKGAIVARMVMDDTSFCFINVHLAAGQSQKAARNADLGAIMEDKAILPASDDLPFMWGGDGSAILDHELVVLNGDLNYRIDQRRENVLSNISSGDLNFLLEHDQLRKEMRGNYAFRLRSFEEATIAFPPTYKYNRGSSEYDSSEKKRIPAWCDRILYNKTPCITPINYQRYETTISDHKPISAGLRMKIKAVDKEKMALVRGQVSEDWTKREIDLLERTLQAFQELM